MKITLDELLIQKLPTPLVQALNVFLLEDHERQAFRSVHRLIDAMEVFCKMYTVAGVGVFLEILKRQLESSGTANKTEFEKIKVMLAAGLKTPSLGIWWKFARDTAEVLNTLQEDHILPGATMQLTHKKSKLKKAFDAENNFITFRNSYAHGATPPESECTKHLNEKWPVFHQLLQEAKPLQEAMLLICRLDGSTALAMGNEIKPTVITFPTEKGHVYFMHGEKIVDVFPLLTFKENPDGKTDFYFYNDMREKYANYLNYPQSAHHNDEEKKGELLIRIPIDEWKKLSSADLNPFKEQIELLTEVFKGRRKELQQVSDFISKNVKGFLALWGPPGVGKSALLARVTQLLGCSPEIRSENSAGINWPEINIRVVEYFIRRGATETATDLFDSLNQRLDYIYNLKMETGKTDEERKRHFTERLKEINKKLKEEERLLLIIDGLDEAKSGDPLISLLPRILPEKILVIYGSRPQLQLKFSFYDELDRENRTQFDLEGLSLADIRAVMMEHVSKYELQQDYVEAVLKKSEGNPLYLKLLCRGLEQKLYTLNDSSILPEGMKELYTHALVKMEKESPGSLSLLTLLAASHDFISPRMAAQLMQMQETVFRNKILSSCLELLYKDPLTDKTENYQLFHESLREFLKEQYPKDIYDWNEKLSDFCLAWKDENGDMSYNNELLEYAMTFAAQHIYDSWKEQLKMERPAAATKRKTQLLELVDNKEWRYKNFETLGNGDALRTTYRLAQQTIAHYDKEGKERTRMLAYSYNMHNEPLLMYEAQRNKLRKPFPKKELPKHLENVKQLALMGENPTQKMLLTFMALWASDISGVPIPANLKTQADEWMELAREKPLNKLWGFTMKMN